MPVELLTKYLNQERVKYTVITHSPAYTAMEIAARAHVPGQELAKTVMVRLDGALAMAVLPASERVDLGRLEAETGKTALLATEDDFRGLFPGCELGAMPPFGNLYDMPVYVSESLTEDEEIAFNAGSHTQLLRMAYADFARLVQPTVLPFAVHA